MIIIIIIKQDKNSQVKVSSCQSSGELEYNMANFVRFNWINM